jgi:phosphohistidine phosphatase
MYLLLMRHGIAIKRDETLDDANRALTKKGRLVVNDVATNLKTLIHKNFALYSSPILRALQTAEIIQKIFQERPIYISDGLATGDHKSFLNNLEETSMHVAIGHEPFLSELLHELTGIEQDFKKASFAVIEIDENNMSSFICYAKVSDLARFNQKIGWHERLNQLIHLMQSRDQHTFDDTQLHQFRTLLRSFDALIFSVKKQTNIIVPKGLEEYIRVMIDLTNELRDLDVLLKELDNNAALESLKERLVKERASLYVNFKSELNSLLEQLPLELILFGLIVQFDKTTQKRKWLQLRFNKLTKRVKFNIKQLDRQSIQDLHDLRLDLKKLIYMGNYHSQYLDKKSIKIAEIAKEIKDYTGTYLDFLNQIEYLNKIIELDPIWTTAVNEYIEQIDQSVPSTFTIHKMLFKLSKIIGD